MSKKNANVAKINPAETVEFTQGNNEVASSATPAKHDSTPSETPMVEADESFTALDAGNSAYADLLKRNELFASSGQAVKAFAAWQQGDKYSMAFIDRAVKEALVKYAQRDGNASPLMHAVLAMQHRGKRNLASKLQAFVPAVTNFKWDDKKKVFRLKKDKPVSTEFTPEQLVIFNKPFWEYTKPAVKQDFDLIKTLKAALAKADREGIAKEQRAQIVRLFATGDAPEMVTVANNAGAILIPQPPQQPVDTQANDKDAA